MTGNFPKRGDVYWVVLDQAIGSETRKRRPCLIISNNNGNQKSQLVIIAPITSKVSKIFPFEAKVIVGKTEGKVMLNQCRSIDKSRLGKRECDVDNASMIQVDEAIRIVFGIA